jgi:L-asparaginase II
MLAKAGNGEELYECGAHWPIEIHAQHAVVRQGGEALAVHNNCSGKHAGMLALARQLGADPKDYVRREHPVQKAIAAAISKMCGVDADALPCGVDGCSVPTWALPVRAMALGFARLTDPANAAAARIIAAVRAHPFMVAGNGRFDTELMQALPRVFVKTGAEGVYCGCIPHAGLGIALKCDDGAGRAAEMAMAAVLARLHVWTPDEQQVIARFTHRRLENWRHIEVGELRAVM